PPFPPGCCATPGPSGPSPAPSSAHRTPGATDNTSPRSRRSGGLRPPCSGPERPEHLSAATWRRSLQACIASLPLQSSLMSKTYLKSDHFNGGGASPPPLGGAGGSPSRFVRLQLGPLPAFLAALRPNGGPDFGTRDFGLFCYASHGNQPSHLRIVVAMSYNNSTSKAQRDRHL